MRIEYSPEVDILIIRLNDKPVCESEHLAEHGDEYDENIAALEVFGWSQRKSVDISIVGKLSFVNT